MRLCTFDLRFINDKRFWHYGSVRIQGLPLLACHLGQVLVTLQFEFCLCQVGPGQLDCQLIIDILNGKQQFTLFKDAAGNHVWRKL